MRGRFSVTHVLIGDQIPGKKLTQALERRVDNPLWRLDWCVDLNP